MIYALIALITVMVGAFPLVVRGRIAAAGWIAGLAFVPAWLIFYVGQPSLSLPLWGLPGLVVLVIWLLTAFVGMPVDNYRYDKPIVAPADRFWVRWSPTCIGVVAFAITLIMTSGIWSNNAEKYSALLGTTEERVWTQDVQPKDPSHMVMVSRENAHYIAKKFVGLAGTIGSQYQIDGHYLTLQLVKGKLVYVVPFDFVGFSVWWNTNGSPGFLIIDAEDPEARPRFVELPKGKAMKCSPGAYFSTNLERVVRNNGHVYDLLAGFHFELDEDEKPHWVITTLRPTVGWDGEVITGVLTVDPTTCAVAHYDQATAPAWIDRIVPHSVVQENVDKRGVYNGGWLNSWWGKVNLTEPEKPMLIYGTDNKRAEWVTGVTSRSTRDDSLIGLYYTDTRTGKSIFYRMQGGATDTAIVAAVDANQAVKFRHLHGSTPQIYNIHGQIAAVVPLLNSTGAYQGVAIVSVLNVQDVAVGQTQIEAMRNFHALISRTGRQIAPDKKAVRVSIEGVVLRKGLNAGVNAITFALVLKDTPKIFTISNDEFPLIAVTDPGDVVKIEYLDGDSSVLPVVAFTNVTLPIPSPRLPQR